MDSSISTPAVPGDQHTRGESSILLGRNWGEILRNSLIFTQIVLYRFWVEICKISSHSAHKKCWIVTNFFYTFELKISEWNEIVFWWKFVAEIWGNSLIFSEHQQQRNRGEVFSFFPNSLQHIAWRNQKFCLKSFPQYVQRNEYFFQGFTWGHVRYKFANSSKFPHSFSLVDALNFFITSPLFKS